MRRSKRLVALVAGVSLVAAACGGDDDDDTATTDAPSEETSGAETTTAETSGSETTTADTSATTEADAGAESAEGGGEAPSGDTVMTVTVNLNPDAVWEDGSPITVADLECTWQANLNTPGAIQTAGYDQISSVEQGESEKQAIINYTSVYGPYKTLFNVIIKKAAVADCNDISGDFSTELPISGRPVMIDSWSESQSVLVPNPNYWGDDTMVAEQFVMVPQTDTDTEIASIKAGQVDYIYPQFGDALGTALQDENITLDIQSGGDYEAIYFQMDPARGGPFADDDYRAAFSMSIDRQSLFDQIYGPIFASAGAEGALLNCGPIVEGPYCPDDAFQNTYDPAAAEQILTDAGWEKDGSGMWAKDGVVPEVRWMVNAGNARRENTQDYLIPLLAQAGFNVVADNCEAECVFQQRLPSLDFDMAMYISTAPPDPTYLTPAFTCDNIPSEENANQGQNSSGWCNEEASDALHQADVTADQADREELVKSALRAMDTDHVLLPLVNYPKSGAWRSDQVGGPLDGETANYRAFSNFHLWEDTNGDGQIVLGAEQWPGCLNPVTECANSSWYVWTVSFPTLPAIWDSTNDQEFEITNLVTEEPVVEVL
jgi:peptide/nickel transport system substrate-binding protein